MRGPNQEALRLFMQNAEGINFEKESKAQDLLSNGLIQEVIRSMYPFSINEDTATYKDVLKGLSIFGDRRVDMILHHCSPDQIVELVGVTAIEIVNMILDLPLNKVHQAKWGENQNKVLEAVQQKFSWFEEIEERLYLQTLAEDLSNTVKKSLDQVLKIGSASVMNEEAALNLKAQIEDRFEDLKAKIEASECEGKVKEYLLTRELPDCKKQAFAHIDAKLAEEPVRLLYYRTGSRAAVKLGWDKRSWKFHRGRGKEVRLNRGSDCDKYSLVVSLSYVEDFLYLNEIKDEDVWVEEESIEVAYRFNDKVSVNLTPSFVAEWYNYDAPVLQRITPNHGKRSETFFGMRLCHFTTNIVESSFSADYISEDITQKEADALIKGYEHTRISKEIRNTLKARKIRETGQIEEIKQWVEAYDAKIQAVIDENAPAILNSLAVAFYDRVESATGTDGKTTFKLNDNFGLDCGFLNIQVNDPEYTEKRSILRNVMPNASTWLDLKLPLFSQSTTVMKKQFEIVREVIKNKLGIELIGHTVLD